MSAADPHADRFYAWVRRVGRFWVWFFFKRVDVRHLDRVPATGPVLLCVNHPNNLIDSLLVGAVVPRKVHYLATATLFRNPVLARFLRACGVIPVHRRQDAPDSADRNAETFAACARAFAEGRLVAIYPEGTTHAETRVQRIKTGAARLALAWEAERPGTLGVVPVGLSFEARKSFHGRVLVSAGEPVPVTPYLAAYRADPVAAVEALTTAIQWAMEAQVVHVERVESTAIVRAIEELYTERLVRELLEERGLAERQVDRFRLSRAIVDAVHHFREREPDRVERLWARLQGYRALLEAYRLRDEAVRGRAEARPLRQRLRGRLRWSWQALAGLPVFAYGAAVNAAPYLLPRWLARRMARRETDYATIRFLASMVAFPVCWGLETWVAWRLGGPAVAAGFAVSLPVTGLLAYRYLRGAARLGRALRFGALAVTRAHAARRLIAEREAVIRELDRARADYLAATRGSSF